MSPLRDTVDRYIRMRRGFGYKLKSEERWLIDLVAFMEGQGTTLITNKLALDWTTRAAGPASWLNRLSAVRGFARHLSWAEPRTQIPPWGILRQPQRRAPYIYTEQEIGRLLEALLALPPATHLRRWTYYSLIGLLTVTGLRISEAIKLKRRDVDLEAGVLTIRKTKFGKSRLVPIHPTTVSALADYAHRRDARPCRCIGEYVVTCEHGGRLYVQNIELVFLRLLRETGLRHRDASLGPRIHDLRHRFAVNTLLRWYQAGEDVERLLPVLSTWLGHIKTRDTYWYLSACPELMEHAANRLEARWEAAS